MIFGPGGGTDGGEKSPCVYFDGNVIKRKTNKCLLTEKNEKRNRKFFLLLFNYIKIFVKLISMYWRNKGMGLIVKPLYACMLDMEEMNLATNSLTHTISNGDVFSRE